MVPPVLCNGLGQYAEALAAAQNAAGHPREFGAPRWGLVELIEAAARSGTPEPATDALERLSETTRASGTDWALGVEARLRALLSEGDAAEQLYREAIERLARTRVRVELARAELVYGEWLRREQRRVDAREHLRTAHEMFGHMGVEGFAERARRELQATGETARRRTDDTRGVLTPQKAQIARLAHEGLSKSRDRRSAVHQPTNGSVPPAQGLSEARDHLAPPARPPPSPPTQLGVGHVRPPTSLPAADEVGLPPWSALSLLPA